MSSLALMRFLEGAPQRYDAGMRLLTLGRVGALRADLAGAAAPVPGAHVLEIGCGTGALTALLVARGARVTAVEQNPEMLELARDRLADAGGAVVWMERTAAEIDTLPAAAFDAVAASLCLSEMSPAERDFVLRAALLRLRAGGTLAVGDEVVPRHAWQRAVRALVAAPQIAGAWLIAGSLSRPIPDLAAEIDAAGFRLRAERRWLVGTLAALIAENPA